MDPQIPLYYIWRGELRSDLCEVIVDECRKRSTPSDGDPKSQAQLRKLPEQHWIKALCLYYLQMANEATRWNFEISELDYAQYAEYLPGDEYTDHVDIHPPDDRGLTRKLSLVINLTDPTGYAPHEVFEFVGKGAPEGFEQRGSVLVFPSFMEHRVLPLTAGMRATLVSFARGAPFR